MTDLSEHLLEILTHSYNLTLTIKPLRSKKAQGNWSPIMHMIPLKQMLGAGSIIIYVLLTGGLPG